MSSGSKFRAVEAPGPSALYVRVLSVIDRYVSRIIARSVLDKSADRCNTNAAGLGTHNLVRVIEEALQ